MVSLEYCPKLHLPPSGFNRAMLFIQLIVSARIIYGSTPVSPIDVLAPSETNGHTCILRRLNSHP